MENLLICIEIINESIKKAHAAIDNSSSDNIPDHAVPLVYAMARAMRLLEPYNAKTDQWNKFCLDVVIEEFSVKESLKYAEQLLTIK